MAESLNTIPTDLVIIPLLGDNSEAEPVKKRSAMNL